MLALTRLHLKENKKTNVFILFAILGALLTIIVTSSVTFSVNTGGDVSSDYAQYGFQWTFLTLLASLAAVSLSMSTMDKHRHGNFSELLSLHGLDKKDQYRSLALGNIAIVIQMSLILLIGMIISLFIKRPDFSLIGLVFAIINYLLAAMTMGILMSLLSLIFPTVVSGLFGIIIALLGALRGALEIIVQNMGGSFGKLAGVLLKLVPPISSFGQISRDLFFGEFSDLRPLMENALYVWILIGILLLVTRMVARYER